MDPEDPDSDPDHSQNLIISFIYLFRHTLKISSKPVHKFLSYLVYKQTDGLTDGPRRKHNLLGGGKNDSGTVLCSFLGSVSISPLRYQRLF